MIAVFKRELKTYFYSPMAYILIGVFTLLCSFFFRYNLYVQTSDFTGMFMNGRIVLVFLLPILTMRILAEDRKNGTEVLLLTSPTSVGSMVVGKYLAAMFVFLAMVAMTLFYQLIITAFGGSISLQTVGGYVGFILFGACIIAVGVFVSSMTENQVIAGIVSIVCMLLIWALGSAATFMGGTAGKVLKWVSIVSRYDNFTKGIFDFSHVAYYLSFIGIFLFLTVKAIEKRRWS